MYNTEESEEEVEQERRKGGGVRMTRGRGGKNDVLWKKMNGKKAEKCCKMKMNWLQIDV